MRGPEGGMAWAHPETRPEREPRAQTLGGVHQTAAVGYGVIQAPIRMQQRAR